MSELLSTLLQTARAQPARGWIATKTSDGSFVERSWGQVHQDARRAAAGLRQRGVGAGDAVALFMGAPADVAVAVEACWLIGASVTMLHQPTARTNLSTYAAQTMGVLRMIDAKALLLGVPYIGLLDSFAIDGSGLDAQVLLIADLMQTRGQISPDADVADEDAIALLQLTSGSTAAPKAVTITHRALISNMRAMEQASQITDEDIMVSWLPTFHDMGMVGFLSVPMVFGYRLIKMTPADFVASPTAWMQVISDYGATITAAPNFAYGLAARSLRRAQGLDLSSLRIALNGAEPIDAQTVEAFCAAGAPHGLRREAMLCAYGMAEAVLAVSFAPPGHGLVVDTVDPRILAEQRRAVAVQPANGSTFARLGPPLPGIEVEVRDESGRPLGERQVGTLTIRGDAVTKGYRTIEGYRAAQDEHGWLDTGDEGYLVDGEIVVCGRVKDLIILAGRNIYPTDLERAAERVPGVRRGNSAAVSIRQGGRESFAIVAESVHHDDEQQVERIRHEVRMATYAELDVRPSRVELIAPGTLPKTPSGKIQRARVRAELGRRLEAGDASS